jgi:hypothetical protein
METIERRYAHRLAEQVERLAHHALRGEMWGKAFRYLREAAAKAVTRSAYREAIAFWEEAGRRARSRFSPRTWLQAISSPVA